MRIVTLLMTLLVVFLFISCDEKKNNTDEGSVVTVTAAYVENGSTIVVEGTNFGETAPTAKLTKVGDTEDAEELTVEEFNDTLIKFTLPVTFGEGSYILAAVTENGDFTVTLVGLKGEDGVDGTDGVEGPKGDKGDQGAKGIDGVDGIDGKDGEPGLDGEDGIDGKDGEPGTDSVCAGNTAPVITKIDLEKAPGKDFRKDVPIKMTLETQDADGDTLAIIFTGMGATIKPEIDGTYTVTPTMLGGPFMFGVILNDGCQTVTGDFTLDKVVTSNDTDNQSLYILTSSDLFILWPQDDDGEQIGGHGLFDVVGLAINPLDGKMYTFSNDGNILYELDRNTAESTLVCELEESVYGLTFGPDGTLYAAMDSGLFSIDISKCTAEWLCDGDGFPWSAINSMAYGEDGLYIKAFEYYVAFKIDIDSNNVDFVSEIYFPDNMDYEFFEMEPGLAYNYANGKFYSAAYDDDYGDDYLVVIDSSWIATTVMT
ncbi:MAG TPA: hypothetical protein P5044_07745, partial [bacterium]|nr:hypothetical protein [bacterium]